MNSLINVGSRDGTMEDFDFIFNTKKEALYQYVVKIWGWDEDVQIKWLQLVYKPKNMKILTYKNIDIGIFEIIRSENNIELCNIELIPEYRSKGIATYLINNLKLGLNAKGKISLSVFKDNLGAIRLYKKLKFRHIGSSEYHHKFEFTH